MMRDERVEVRRRVVTRALRALTAAALLATVPGCASLGSLGSLSSLIQPPRFERASSRDAEIRMVGPTRDSPLGGAAVRLWMRVTNPNPFGLTLSTIQATLALDGSRAASGDFPLGLPLSAGTSTSVPIDVTVSFADVPDLALVVRRAIDGRAVGYQLDGTVGVTVPGLGPQTFGPMALATGDIRVGLPR